MKTTFLASAYLLLMLVILALLAPQLWRKKRPDTSTRDRINARVYRDQLGELTHDRSTGALTEEDYQRAKIEIDRRVLEEMGHTPANTSAVPSQDPATANRIAFLIVLFVPLLAMPLYFKLGNPAALEPQASSSNDQATDYWSQVLKRVDAGSNDEKNLKTSIAKTKEKAQTR